MATETLLECMRGPMDGEVVAPSALNNGALRMAIASRMCTLADGTRLHVWRPCPLKQAELYAHYEQQPEGQPHHLHFVRSEPPSRRGE